MSADMKKRLVAAFESVQGYKGLDHERMADAALRVFDSPSLDELAALTRENYTARARGELPDEMFWADRELLKRGYALNDAGEPEPIMPSERPERTP